MKSTKCWLIRRSVAIALERRRLTYTQVLSVLSLSVFLSLGVIGCASTDSSDSTRFEVIPVGSRDVAALGSNDIVRLMRRAGFSDEQILELGTQVRNALLMSGAVEVKQGKVVEAIFAINDNYVYITARLRGNFIYNLEKGSWIGLENVSPQSKPLEAPMEAVPRSYPQSNLPNYRIR